MIAFSQKVKRGTHSATKVLSLGFRIPPTLKRNWGSILKQKPQTLNPKPQARNPKPKALPFSTSPAGHGHWRVRSGLGADEGVFRV